MFTLTGTRRVLAVLVVPALVFFAAGVAGCATFGKKAAPMPISKIVEESRAGVPAQEIIKQIRASGMVFRLTASQLADLRQQGVSNQVLDFMQQTYLQAVRRRAELQDDRFWYQENSFWYGGVPYGWPYDEVRYYYVAPPPPPPAVEGVRAVPAERERVPESRERSVPAPKRVKTK